MLALFASLWRRKHQTPAVVRLERYLDLLIPALTMIASGRGIYCAMWVDAGQRIMMARVEDRGQHRDTVVLLEAYELDGGSDFVLGITKSRMNKWASRFPIADAEAA